MGIGTVSCGRRCPRVRALSIRRSLLLRHSGESPRFVIPAKAGIQFLALALGRYRDNRLTSLCLFSRHPWRASHFSLLAQREVTKRKGTRVTRPPAAASLR